MALYNKVRPLIFDEVVGQDNIVKNLRNQSIQNSFFGTYIFSGQYGGGKTTMSRILAAAINCENKGADGNPCCRCRSCRSIIDKTAIDFVEIDGASNTGVDKVRELIADASFQPVSMKKKVICIDEVHMLSTSAFNALLKTLEEPPETVVFILCTTEERKIPDTVRSRSACYAFGKIDRHVIFNHIKGIAQKEGYNYTDEGLQLIARRSDGSMRNALSLVEQVAVNGAVVVENVNELLSIADTDTMVSLIKYLLLQNMQKTISELPKLLAYGSAVSVISDMSDIVRDLILVQMHALDEQSEYSVALRDIRGSMEDIIALSDMLISLKDKLRAGYGKELVTLEFAKFSYRQNRICELEKRVEELEKQLRYASVNAETAITEPSMSADGSSIQNADDLEENIGYSKISDNITENIGNNSKSHIAESIEAEEDQNADEEIDELDAFCDGLGLDSFMIPSFTTNTFFEENCEPNKNVISKSVKQTEKSTRTEPELPVDSALEAAAKKDVIFREAILGCNMQLENDKTVLVANELPIYKVVNACVNAYRLGDAVLVKYQPA